jgi:hypothetical protein
MKQQQKNYTNHTERVVSVDKVKSKHGVIPEMRIKTGERPLKVTTAKYNLDKQAAQVFSEYFGFPCTIFISQISPQSPSPIIRGWYNRPVVAAVPRDSVSSPKNNKKNYP